MENNNNNNNNGNGQPPKKQNFLAMLIAALISLLCIAYFMSMITGATSKEITYNEFINMIENGQIDSVKIESSQIDIYPKKIDSPVPVYLQSKQNYYTGKCEDDETLTNRLLQAGITVSGTVPDSSGISSS